jgi:hypothetical protein
MTTGERVTNREVTQDDDERSDVHHYAARQ